ncbi:hypothetical protein ACX93W_01720 [Paenibacillus sp. CAU 1782]
MTKYSNVVINGKTLEVPAQSAVTYEQVGGVGEGNGADIEAGDVIVYEEAPISDITAGVAYVVTEIDSCGDAQITDDEGDSYDTSGDTFTTYRKVPEKKRLTVGDYAKVTESGSHNYDVGTIIEIVQDDRDGSPYRGKRPNGNIGNFLREREVTPATKAEFDAQSAPPADSETVIHEGREYRKISRNANVGDLVVITANKNSHGYKIGAIVKVAKRYDNGGKAVGINTGDALGNVRDSDYLTLEPARPVDPRSQFGSRLTAGDKVRLISGGGQYPLNGYANGTVYTVDNGTPDSDDHIRITGGEVSRGYAKPDQLVKVTETESLEVGDSVIFTEDFFEHKIGKIAVIREIDECDTLLKYGLDDISGKRSGWTNRCSVRLATAEEVAAARYAAKIGDFKDGDWAEIVNPTDENADSSVIRAKGQTVKVIPYGPSGYRGLTLTSSDGTRIGYANADALRKVDEPKPTRPFAIGDKVRIAVPESVALRHGRAGVKNSEVGEVTAVSSDRVTVNFPSFGNGWDGLPGELTTVTEEEAVQAAESAKWAAIGRKVNEYKAGDIVLVVRTAGGHPVGTIGEVVEQPDHWIGGKRIAVKAADGSVRDHTTSAKLVTPVEQRFDKAVA